MIEDIITIKTNNFQRWRLHVVGADDLLQRESVGASACMFSRLAARSKGAANCKPPVDAFYDMQWDTIGIDWHQLRLISVTVGIHSE